MSSPGSATGSRVADVGERALIERIRARVPAPDTALVVGIGDDAAVAVPDRGALQVLTTDALVEGVHFDRRFSTPTDVGHKALAVNVSDVASMGGTPRFALLSLMLPAHTTLTEVDQLLDGLLDLAKRLHITLAGGNITRSPGPLVVDVTVAGSVRPRRILTRAGGRAGDDLYVTGRIGAAVAGLEWLREQCGISDDVGEEKLVPPPRPSDGELAECVERYCRPEPRARLGAILGRTRAASACMDLSDGLADAVTQIASASHTGAEIDAALLPIHSSAQAWFNRKGADAVSAAVAGGDDYELLFAVPPKRRGRLRGVFREARGVPITRIGALTAERSVGLTRNGRLEPLPTGFVHF
ncbi:MAG TPA: thiamine-phosphate kinase [Vicinamibacterales bacterium]|nr:thiamine-phosphate kinase [Vicinamibacterales bacterium]